MRHIIISVSLLVLSLAFCLVSSSLVSRACSETNALLQQAQSAAQREDFETARRYLKEADETWAERERFFGVVLRHDEADDVFRDFAELKAYAETTDSDEFLAACASVMATIEHIGAMTRAAFHNILSAPCKTCAP